MRTSKLMQQLISQIAAKHALDLAAPLNHLRLEMQPYQPLVIEKIGKFQLSVAHYAYQHGDAIADPEIVFFTGYEAWVVIEITQWVGGYRRIATLNSDGTKIDTFYPRAQRDATTFATFWARNIRDQGWLKHGVPAQPTD